MNRQIDKAPTRPLSLGIAALLTATVSLLFTPTASPAHADETPPEVSNESTAAPAPVYDPNSGTRENATQDNTEIVAEYWTEERMANAIPVDTPTLSPEEQEELAELTPTEAEPEMTVDPALPTSSQPSAPPAETVTNWSHVNGKVFYRDATDGRDYICSASAINSGSKTLVATAGHCVHHGPGGTWHENWQFVPGYDRGTRPHGTFYAQSMRTMTDWIDYGESPRGFNSDVAFVTTTKNSEGQGVVDAVGGHGMIYGGSQYSFYADIFGYPGNLDSGEVMWSCSGDTHKRWYWSYNFSGINGCNFGGGASGGPWLKNYDNSTGVGHIKTVSSWGPKDSAENINGPLFRTAIYDMYLKADQD